MVKALITAAQAAKVQLYELGGAAALTTAAGMWHPAAALAVVGVALLGKSLEHDFRRRAGGGD